MTAINWWQNECQALDEQAQAAAQARQLQLTKPAGSLGQLEDVAVRLAAHQGCEKPQVQNLWFVVFAGDHGVVQEGVAAYPQAVTVQMLANFMSGGAAISVLAREQQAHLELHNLGTVTDASHLRGVVQHQIMPGTDNFCLGPAMSAEQCAAAMAVGRSVAQRASVAGCDLILGGEMGIGNTTAASALACALLQRPLDDLIGIGTGLDAAGMQRKKAAIEKALLMHQGPHDAWQWLQRLGGLEIAALTGLYIACAQEGVTVLVDGVICTAAAMLAVQLNPQVRPWLLFAHSGAEPGHKHLLSALDATPLLQLGLRLGEGSGAALAVPLIRLACVLHGQMATFAEAAVEESL